MKYQLALQFPSDMLLEMGGATALEEALTTALGEDSYVDGSDLGFSETTLFIFTSDPAATFERAGSVLERWNLMESVIAAHRPSDGETYTVIWPHDCRKAFSIAESQG